MRALEQRAAVLADRARSRRVRQVAEQLQRLMPDADVDERGAMVQVAGAGLRRRWLNHPALRFLAKGLP